jgi:hypothetical protein
MFLKKEKVDDDIRGLLSKDHINYHLFTKERE